jgi:MFS family permease
MKSTKHDRDAWIVLIGVFASMFIVFGIRLSYSVFFAAFTGDEGWSREASAGIFSVTMVVFGLLSVPSGLLVDRLGPRKVFATGAAFMAVGLWLSSLARTVEEITITYGIITGIGITILGLGPQGGIVSLWFPRNRGMAIGVAFAGTGFGAMAFTPLTAYLLRLYGWRGAHVVLALVCALILLPVILIGQRSVTALRPPAHERVNVRGQGGILRSPVFWALMLVSFGALGPLRSLTVHQVAYLEDIGYTREHASAFVGLAGLLTAVAYIGWGPISDRLGRGPTFLLGSLGLAGAVGILWWLGYTQARSDLFLFAYSILYAAAEGTRSSQPTAMATDAFGHSRVGFITGAVGAMFGIGAAFAPWIVGRLFDVTGNYDTGFEIVLLMVAISMAGAFAVGRATRRSVRVAAEAAGEAFPAV